LAPSFVINIALIILLMFFDYDKTSEQTHEDPSSSLILTMKPDAQLPKEYTLILGLKAVGVVLAKSLSGLALFPKGQISFKNGGIFANIYLPPGKPQVVLTVESEFLNSREIPGEVIKNGLLEGAEKILIFESIPWTVARSWGFSEFTLGVAEEQNLYTEYDSLEAVPIKDTFGYALFEKVKTKPTKYYLAILAENRINMSDVREVRKLLEDKEKLEFVENKLASSLKIFHQTMCYI
jgi:hypothetical protein